MNENLNKIFGYSEILNLSDQITSLLAEPSLASACAVDIADLELKENAIENLSDENNNLEDVDLNNNHVTEPKSKLNTNANVQDCNEIDSIYEPRENIPKHSSFDNDPKRILRTECCHEEREIYKNNNQLNSTFLIDAKVSNYHKIKNVVSSSNLKTTAEEKILQKINRQKKIENAIKTALMPHFKRKHINKEEYKDILKKSVTKVSQSKDKDIEITTTYEKDYLYIV